MEAELLAKASQLIAARGVDQLSLRELGRAAGVSRAAPYHYFPTKAALLQRVGEAGFTALAAAIRAALGEEMDPPRAIMAGLEGYLAFALAEPAIYQLMFANVLPRNAPAQPGQNAFSSAAAAQAFELLVDGVRAPADWML